MSFGFKSKPQPGEALRNAVHQQSTPEPFSENARDLRIEEPARRRRVRGTQRFGRSRLRSAVRLPPGLPSQPSDAAGTVVVFPVAGGSPTRFPGEQPDGGGPDGPPDSSPGSGGPRKSKAVRGFAALLRRGAGLKARLAREPAGVPHLRATVAAPNERTDRPLWGLGRHRWRIRFSGWIFVARSGRNRKSLPLILRSNPDLGPGVGGQATPDRSKPPQTSCFAATTQPPWTRRGD